MTVKIQQQLDNSYSQNNIDSNNEDDQQIKVVAIIGHYITHVGFHFLAINYLLVYILFKDAQENYSYMIKDVKSWRLNLIITFFYFTLLFMYK